VTHSGSEVLFKTCVAMKFVDDDDDDGKREDYQNCSVLYCVLNLCTAVSTLG